MDFIPYSDITAVMAITMLLSTEIGQVTCEREFGNVSDNNGLGLC